MKMDFYPIAFMFVSQVDLLKKKKAKPKLVIIESNFTSDKVLPVHLI